MDPRTHRIVLLDPATDKVLVVRDAQGAARLPVHEDRWVEHRELAGRAGDPAALPGAPSWREDDGTVTHVLVAADATRADGEWWPVADLAGAGVAPAGVARLTGVIADLRAGRSAAGEPDWYRPGWYDDATAWIDGVLEGGPVRRTGPPELERAWSLSAVLRVPVDGEPGTRWFKATCEHFQAEPALTAAVSALLPDLTPRVVAVDADRAWMLMLPIDAIGEDPEEWPEDLAVARGGTLGAALVDAQTSTLADLPGLLASGIPDRGLTASVEAFHEVVHGSVETPMMSEEQRRAAVRVEPWVVRQAEELWSLGLPDTLAHGDLHLGNVAWPGGRPLLFDWTDACVTHPYLDAQHLAESVRRSAGEAAAEATWEGVMSAWRARLPEADHDRARVLAGIVDLMFQAVTYEHIYRAQSASSRWALSSYVVRTLDGLVALERDATTG